MDSVKKLGLWLSVLGLCLLIASCSSDRQPAIPTATQTVIARPTMTAAPPSLTPEPTAQLLTDSGAFENMTALLDGVCYEFLRSLDGETWVWTAPADLAAFYDRADASELCPTLARRQAHDFAQHTLAGTVTVGAGCDAAHRVVAFAPESRILTLAFEARPGCAYELVQPFLVAIPREFGEVQILIP